MSDLKPQLRRKHERLRAVVAELDSLIVGLSGGVDSVLLATVAHDVLGDRSLAVTADSPSLPRRELREAVELAERIGIPHLVVKTDEVTDPRYAANPHNRCFFCKDELFTKLGELARERGFRAFAYGENVSDQGDHRPGALAAGRHGARAPLREAGLDKDDIRALASHLGLPVWDKPAFACLGSRFPYGTEITPEKLAQVEQAEELLWELGLRQFRVRHHGDIARIEVPPEDMPSLLEHGPWLVDGFRALGYTFVTMDLGGYRRGGLNSALIPAIGSRA